MIGVGFAFEGGSDYHRMTSFLIHVNDFSMWTLFFRKVTQRFVMLASYFAVGQSSSVVMSQSVLPNGPLLVSNGTLSVSNAPASPSLLPIPALDDNTLSNGPQEGSVFKTSSGDWGKLEYYPVYLEAPSYLVEALPLPSSQTRWVIPEALSADFEKALISTGMDDQTVQAITKTSGRTSHDGMLYIFPPTSIVEDLTADVRAKLYAQLANFPANEHFVEPILIPDGNVEAWFSNSELRPDLIATIKKLAYMRGDILAFSDFPILMQRTSGEAEARNVMKATTRTRSLAVKVVLERDTDIPALLAYWTTGLNTRRKDLEPLLRSIISTCGAEKLDILHLLPPLPRKLLMTYPDVSHGLEGQFPDCHWTSLNFFNYREQPHLLDSKMATTAVLDRFATTERPYKFGDIIFVLNPQTGDAFHSCVYIADEIVFTKNGRNVLSPWVLLKLDDMQRLYIHHGNGRLQGYRNKNVIPTAIGSPLEAGPK
jgi:hypothetical protein